jgi:ubiquinone/menaquinone biosynthesis C-methylase UbiE
MVLACDEGSVRSRRIIHPGFTLTCDTWSMSPTTLRPALPPSPARAVGGTIPPTYDLSYRDEFWASRPYEDECDRLAIRALLPRTGGRLLDVGAGFGRLVDEYRAFDSVTLVDASAVMLEASRERVGADPRFSIVAADAAHMPIADGTIDVAVAVRLLVHLRDPTDVLREIARVMRPGGCLIVEFPNRHHLVASVRYLSRRQTWSPTAAQPHEYRQGHFSHQPATIEAQLRSAGFEPDTWRAVSLFRSAWIKRSVPAHLLAAIERRLQGPLGRLAPGPSSYVRSIRLDAATLDGIASARVQVRRAEDDPCGS